MDVLIVGAGVAGLTLAYWLARAGRYRATLVERAPSLRGEGYMIDFFGSGYDVAERMGLLRELETIHYPVSRLAFVDARGCERASVSYATFRTLLEGRHFNFMRGDLEQVLFRQVADHVPVRFDLTVAGLDQRGGPVAVQFSDGSSGAFDLVVGADGVHSDVRALVLGAEARFTRSLGYRTAAYIVADPPPSCRGLDALYTVTVPGRQVGVYPVRGGRIATFFLHQVRDRLTDRSFEAGRSELLSVYGDLGWVVPEVLARCEPTSFYRDDVVQIELPQWRCGGVALVGDSCQCVSLVAGQGASLAVTGAYLLARELARRGADLPTALAAYERRLKPAVARKQRAGRRLARWFLPDTRARLAVRDLFLRMSAWPGVSTVVKGVLAPDRVLDLREP